MPTYEFRCDTCGPFEQRRRIQDAGAPMRCPTCQAEAARIYSTAGVILTSGAVRRRIERGAEPQVVTRSTPEAPASKPPQAAQGRPWQLGHGARTAPANPNLQRL